MAARKRTIVVLSGLGNLISTDAYGDLRSRIEAARGIPMTSVSGDISSPMGGPLVGTTILLSDVGEVPGSFNPHHVIALYALPDDWELPT